MSDQIIKRSFFLVSILDLPERQCTVINKGVTFSHQKSPISAPSVSTEFLQQSLSTLSAFSQTSVEPRLRPMRIHTTYNLSTSSNQTHSTQQLIGPNTNSLNSKATFGLLILNYLPHVLIWFIFLCIVQFVFGDHTVVLIPSLKKKKHLSYTLKWCMN